MSSRSGTQLPSPASAYSRWAYDYLSGSAAASSRSPRQVPAVWHSRAVPDPEARSLNFLASGGIGFQIGKRARRSYVLGYRFTHLSNANTAASNPGYNAHVFYLGLTIR
jgi:hypothetical protein